MARTAAPKTAAPTITTMEGHTYTMTSKHAFEIPAEEVAQISTRGRKAAPSIYHDDVAHAAEPGNRGKMFGIKPTEDQKVTTVLSQLRIAAKAHGVKIKTVNNLEKGGYVGFIISDETAKESAE